MRVARVALRTHAVGQGLFLSGLFSNSVSSFRFVYDCGAVKSDAKYLDAAVSRYKRRDHNGIERTGKSRLDLLMISHLHYDHFAGLPGLLQNLDTEFAVLPYLTPLERLLVLSTVEEPEPWYIRAMSDPVSFLVEMGVQHVLLLGTGAKEEVEGPGLADDQFSVQGRDSDTLTPNEPPRLAFDPSSFRLPEDPTTSQQVQSLDPKIGRLLRSGRLLVRSHRGFVNLAGWWAFKFFCLPIETKLLAALHTVVGATVGRTISDERPLTQLELESILSDAAVLSYLGEVVSLVSVESKKVRKNINNTSLTVYHSPLNGLVSRCRVRSIGQAVTEFGGVPGPQRSQLWDFGLPIDARDYGHFLLGDVDLTNSYILAKSIAHFSDTPLDCTSFQIPHHGSKENWNASLFELLGDPLFSTVSAGIDNRYGHPSPLVIESLLDNWIQVMWANQFSEIEETAVLSTWHV